MIDIFSPGQIHKHGSRAKVERIYPGTEERKENAVPLKTSDFINTDRVLLHVH